MAMAAEVVARGEEVAAAVVAVAVAGRAAEAAGA